jgi:hypothetical protein
MYDEECHDDLIYNFKHYAYGDVQGTGVRTSRGRGDALNGDNRTKLEYR